jgi:hypothetical protein
MLSVFAAVLMVVGVAGLANAAPLKWVGTMKVELGTLPTAFAQGSGVATVNSSSGLGHLNTIRLAGGITTQVTVPVTDPETTQTNGIVAVIVDITNIGPGTLAFGSMTTATGTAATLPVKGTARVCLLDPACNPGGFLPLNLTTNGGATGFGVGGLLTIGGQGSIKISIVANPWTLGQGSSIDQTDNLGLTTVYSTGFAHGPASLTSSTAAPSGVVKFITPLQVSTNITGGSAAVLKLFSTLKLHFVPEPGMLLLLGSGVVGLVLLGRHRMKK